MTEKESRPDLDNSADIISLRREMMQLRTECAELRKRALESEGWLHDVIEGMADGLLILDNFADGVVRVTYANRWAAAIFGETAEELVGTELLKLIHPDEQNDIMERWALAEQGALLDLHVYRVLRRDGTSIWVKARCDLVSKSYCGPAGTRMISLIRAVSQDHDREEEIALRRLNWALAAHSRSMSVLLRSGPLDELMLRVCESIVEEPAYLLATFALPESGSEKSVRFVAKAGLATGYLDGLLVSWSADTPLGRGPTGVAMREGIAHIVSDTHSDLSFAPWRQLADDFGIRSSVTVPCVHGGRLIGALLVYASETNAFGAKELALFQRLSDEIGFAMALEADRVQLQDAQQAREKAEQNLNAAVLLGPGLLYRAKMHADHMEVLDIFGDVGRVAHDFVGGEDSKTAIANVVSVPERLAAIIALEDTTAHSEDYQVTATDGSSRWLRNSVRIIARTDDAVECVGYLSEVTQEKEQDLRHRKLNTLVTLGEMATGMAHELNQPLASIALTAENATMRLRRTPPDIEIVQAKLERIQTETLRASHLISHMRIFARNERQDLQPVAWAQVLDEAIEILQSKLLGTNVIKKLTADLPKVIGSAIPMEQVLINLISNAIDAYVENNITPRVIIVTGQVENDEVALRVTDRAGGIPLDVIPRMFEPFFTTKPSGKGTGLGLSITADAMAQMGGSVSVANVDGGAEFTLRLPIAQEA